ncbi:MAG: multiheme c-type cytochrome [Gammaproteobacteria bacterium]
MLTTTALRRRLLWAVTLALLAGAVVAAEGGVPLPVIPMGKGEQCVEPTPVIRRNHMVFLLHQRDATMHQGIRTKRHSLVECIECHVSVDDKGYTIPVNAPGQFCETCHSYAGVSMDCFQCHATTPDSGEGVPEAMRHSVPGADPGAPTAASGRVHSELASARGR